MHFSHDDHDPALLIVTADETLNEVRAESFIEEVEALVDEGVSRMIVDLGAMRWFSSFALNALLRFRNRLKTRSGRLKLCGVSDQVRQVLAATNLDRLFETCDDLGAARAALTQDGGGPRTS